MEPIQGKTKIKKWMIVDDKEEIAFERFDLAPRQVGCIERILRHPDDVVKLTIEPEQQKLKIKPIECYAHLGPMDCRKGGQQLTIAKFTSPNDRADSLKALAQAATALLVTIAETQTDKPLFDKDDLPATPAAPATDANPANLLDINIPKTYNANIRIKLHPVHLGGLGDPDGWHVTAAIKIPHHEAILRGPVMDETPPNAYDEPGIALAAIETVTLDWLNHDDRAKYPYGKKLRGQVIKQIEARIAELEPEGN